jgi:hypothetical protein
MGDEPGAKLRRFLFVASEIVMAVLAVALFVIGIVMLVWALGGKGGEVHVHGH